MSFKKLTKGLYIYFGVVIFMVLLFSVCGMVDKNSNSSSSNDISNSNDVSKTESGLIGKWELIMTIDDWSMEIKNDNTIKCENKGYGVMDGAGNKIDFTKTFEGKIININSTARQFVIKGSSVYNDSYYNRNNQSAWANIVPYYLSDDKQELIILDPFSGSPLGAPFLKK